MSGNRIGFGVSPAVAVALNNTWDGVLNLPIALTAVADDTRSSAFPPALLLGSLDLDLDTIAGVGSIQAMLTWDAAGTKVIAGPSSAMAIWAGAGVPVGRSGVSLALNDRPAQNPSSITPGTLYLWLKLDAGTANLSALGARLNWRAPGLN